MMCLGGNGGAPDPREDVEEVSGVSQGKGERPRGKVLPGMSQGAGEWPRSKGGSSS